MKKLRHVLVVGLLVAVPVTVMASACAPLTADQIAQTGGDPIKYAETSFLQWFFTNVLSPFIGVAAPHDPV
jgi:hypothetical protein